MVHDDLIVHGQGWTLEFAIFHIPKAFEKIIIPEAFEKIIRGNGREARNYSLLGIFYLCRTRQHPSEACLKRRRGSKWAFPPAVKNYTTKSIHTQ